jgi:hypothetical protein
MGILSFLRVGHIPYTGISPKAPSSFRLHGNPFIILMLQAERCFSHLSVTFHFVWLRLENHSTEIEKSFGAELFTALRNERKLKDGLLIFHSIIYYITSS